VILAHRLLKNDVPDDEYLLVTEPWLEVDAALPDWAHLARGESAYDDIGAVRHGHVLLGGLKAALPEPEPIAPPTRSSNPVRVDAVLTLPLPAAFELVANFDHRLLWNKGVDDLEYTPGRANRVGTPHRCVIGGRVIDFETTTTDFGPGRFVYGERLLTPTPVVDPVVYYILEEDPDGTRVTAEAHFATRGLLGALKGRLFRIGIRKNLAEAMTLLQIAAVDFEATGPLITTEV
jgi:hypothetical protein